MTSEERRRLMKQLARQSGSVDEAQVEALDIEAPKEDTKVYVIDANDSATRRQMMKQLAGGNTETDYSKGVALANKEGSWLDSTYDRNTLTSYYNAYQQDLQRAIENKDRVQYEKNALLLNRVAEKLGKQANVGTFAQDVASETGGNIRLNVADVARNVAKAATELNPSINLNADVLYNVAKGEAGKLGDTVKNYRWGASEIAQLQSLYEKYPNDKVVDDLYKTVTKQGYKGDKQYFKDTVAYINQLERNEAYNKSAVVRNTQDEKNFMQNQKLKEELTYQEPIDEPSLAGAAKFTLQGVGTAAYMAPAVGTAVVSGGIAGGLGAGKTAIDTASQFGSLIEMYNAASGSAFDQTLREGYDWDKASLYGKLMGALEVTTELIGGESVNAALFNKTVGKTALSPVMTKLIEKGSNDMARFMISVATDIAGEATEEVISALIEPIINYSVLGKDTTAEEYWQGILDGAIGSVLPTLILGGYGKAQTISTVNKTEQELLKMIDDYRNQPSEFFPKDKLDELENTVKTWSNRARAGIEEHYDEVKKQTENYEDVMNKIYANLQTRPMVSMDIATFAEGVQDMEPKAREQAIINYAKEQGIDEAQLRQMYGGYREMFPYSYQQAEGTINRWAQTPIAETQAQNAINSQTAKTAISNVLNITSQAATNAQQGDIVEEPQQVDTEQGVPEEEETTIEIPSTQQEEEQPASNANIPKDSLSELEEKFGTKRETRNGIDVVELPPDTDVYSGIRSQGQSKDITQDELSNSPVYFTVHGKNSGKTYTYVYKNTKDMIKDWDKTYGGLTEIIGKGKDKSVYTIMSASGKGEFYYVRDKLALGGWKWVDANNEDVSGYKPNKRLQASRDEHERNKKVFEEIENKYGTKQTETIDGKTITYINIDKQGKKFPYWQYFWFDNPLTTNDGKQDGTIDTGILNWRPVVAIVYERGYHTAKAFKYVHDLKLWLKEHGGTNNSNFTIARNTSGSSYSLAIEDGEFVWRSDFDGRRVKPEVGPTIIEEAQGKFKTALKNPSKAVRHIDFRGKTFSDAAEFANVMQPAIDPLGETLRVVFTKKEGGKERILGIEETSDNIHAMTNSTNYPNKAGSFLYEYGDFIARKAKALGADYVYEMHNHPGSSEPSGSYGGSDDLGSSTNFKKAINRGMQIEGYNFKYGGGLVIGYDGYSFYGGGNRTGFKNTAKKQGVYTSNGNLTNRDVFVQVPYTNGYKYDGFVDEPWVNMQTSLTTLKDLAEQIPSEAGYSKVILSDLDRKPMYVGNIKNSALLQSPHKVNALLYELSRNYGGGRADVYSTSQAVLDNLKKKGMLVHTIDGIDREYLKSPNKYIAYYEPREGNSARSYVKWYTPKDEVVDDEDFIARDTKPEAEKKEPRHRLEKKQPSLADQVNAEYKRLTSNAAKERETQDRYDIVPTDLEKKNTDIEQAIRDIESGKKEPELGRARRSLAEMRRYINKIMGGRMGLLKGPASKKAYGIWKGATHWIRATQMSNVSTWFHEWGHNINGEVLNMDALNKAFQDNPKIKDELNKLCEEAFGDIYDKKPTTKLMEGFAEAVRRYIENPEGFADKFTNVANLFANEAEQNKNFAEMLAHMKVLSEMVKDYINQPGDERLISNVDMHGEGGEPIRVQGILNRLVDNIVEYMFNDAVYATKLTRQAAKKRGVKYTELKASEKFDDILKVKGNAQNIIQQLGTGTYDDYGRKITYGFREIMEEFLPTKSEAAEMGLSLDKARSKRIEDLVKYGIAIREKTLLDTRGEDLMLGTRLGDINYTINKYKNDAKIQRAMEMINDNSKALINYAVEKGLIKKATGDQILRDNVMYFPLNRVMEDRLSTTLGNSKTGSTGKSFYKLKGSDLQISNPLISLMNNWGRIIYQIEHNDMLKAMVAMGRDNDEIGYWFDTRVPPKMSFKGSVSMENFKEAFEKELEAVGKDMGLNLPIEDMIESMNFDEIYNLFVPEAGDPSQRMMSYLDNGVRKTIQFANNELGNGLYRLLTNLDTQKSNLFLNIMNKINMPLKVGATAWNVEFALSNMQSDALQRFLYSNGTAFYIPILTSMYNVGKYMNSRYAGKLPWKPEKAGELYEKFMRSGASQEGTFRGDQLWLRDHMKDVFGYAEDVLFGKKKMTSFNDFRRRFNIKKSNIAEKLNYVSEVSEQATRFAEFVMVYNQSIAKGFSEQEAIKEAGMKARQVTQDFTVQGKLMREINKIVPFASATIGGLYRFGVEARNHPVRLTARLSALAAVAMLIEGMMDGEDRDYYEEINKQKRFDNFFFKNPDDPQHPFIIKKPQGPARYLINLAQLMTNASMGRIPEDKIVDEFYDWLTMSVDDQLPVTKVEDLLPGGLQAFVENAVNKDFYYGTPIVSKDLEKLDPKDQYDEYTSEIAKAIGGAINYSPAKLDNIINTWFAGLGKQLSGGVDAFVRRNQENKAPAKDISEQIMRSKVFSNAFRSSESINEVYDRIGELETEEAEGRLTEEQSREYSKLQEAKSALAQLNKKMKEVRENSNLSAEEKADKINTLREERIDTARYYLGKKVLNPSNQKKIEKIAYYPSNDTYTYTVNKKKYEVTFDEKLKEEYATEFMKEYQKQLEALKQTAAYKRSTEQEKLELEKKTKTAARTTTTNKMKKVAYQRQYGK